MGSSTVAAACWKLAGGHVQGLWGRLGMALLQVCHFADHDPRGFSKISYTELGSLDTCG